MELHDMFGLVLLGGCAGFMVGIIIAISKDWKKVKHKEDKQ